MTVYYFGGAYELNGAGAFDNNNKLIFTVTPTDVKKYYSFGGQTAMRDADGLQYFLTDHLGSTVATTDNDGTLTSQQRYLPFGGIRSDVTTPNAPNSDFGYTGQRMLDSGMGGLMDYKARFYSPLLGRFTQPDSIIPNVRNPQTWNRYSYIANNPILYNDPDGHCGPLCIIGLVGIFFILNSTNDTKQNLSPEEAESRQVSFALGVSVLSISNPVVEHLSNIADCMSGAYCSPDSWAIPGSASAYRKHVDEDNLDGVFVSVSPSKHDTSIDTRGLMTIYSQENPPRIWLTKYGDVKNIKKDTEFETILYKKSL